MDKNQELQRELEDCRDRLSLFDDHITDMVSVHNTDGSYNFVSKSCTALLGYKPSELIGTSSYEYFHPDDIPDVEISHESILKEPVIFTVQYRLRKKDGNYLWVETTSKTTLDDDGRISEIVAVTRDISERKNAEENLATINRSLEERVTARTRELDEARKVAEEANSAKTEFLSSISHELRTPLHSILGFTEVLQGGHYGDLNEMQQKYLQEIRDSGNHLLEIINRVIDFVYVDSASSAGEIIDVYWLLEESLAMARGMNSKVTTSGNIVGDVENCQIRCSRRGILMVMNSLLSNAVKFSPSEGNIKVAVACEDEIIRIVVSDAGMGIPQEEHEKVFQPFYQVSGSIQGKTVGLGLGLTLARKIVELNRGVLEIEKSSPSGTDMVVSLPRYIES